MALYLIGDIQGCDAPLSRLLHRIDYSPSRDTLYVLGDLVNRGPASAAVLRRLMHYGASARCLLGNHDLHLLAVAAGARSPHRKDTLAGILQAPDRHAMLEWLRHQSMAMLEKVGGQPLLMVHAGVLPQWTADQTLQLAHEVEQVLRSTNAASFFHAMYGNAPTRWHDTLTGMERTRAVVNALTRLRFCTADGEMEFDTKDSADAAPPGYMPWFDAPNRQTADVVVAFGHWSTLGGLHRTDVLALDSGCVWGGCLTALQVSANAMGQNGLSMERIDVRCEQAQKPGKPGKSG